MPEKQFVADDHNKIITVGLPLPNFVEHITDVSEPTRMSLERAYDYARDQGLDVFEIKKRGINVSANHNDLVQSMKGDWLLICGSDHAFGKHAIHTLWQATQEPPYPKIIGGVMPYRHPPHAYVFSHLNSTGEVAFSSVPYKHFHPGITMSGEIMKVDMVGSGFTLYHRSVFDTVPQPWFSYETKRLSDTKLFHETLRDFDGERTFSDFLEDLTHGNTYLSDEDKETLRKKAAALRRIIGLSRRHIAFGPDFGFCLKAKEYGFDTYVHWGLDIQHSTFVPIHNGYFIANIHDPATWFRFAIGGEELSMDGLKDDIELLNRLSFNNVDPEKMASEYEEKKETTEEVPA